MKTKKKDAATPTNELNESEEKKSPKKQKVNEESPANVSQELSASLNNGDTPQPKKRGRKKKQVEVGENGIVPTLNSEAKNKSKKDKAAKEAGPYIPEDIANQSNENLDPVFMQHLLGEKPKGSKKKKKANDILDNEFIKTEEIFIKEEMIQHALETESDEDDISPLLQYQQEQNEEIVNSITWPEKDLAELFRRMESAIPVKDTMVFSTRAEKLKWESIAFNEHTADDCKNMWMLVSKRLRRYRVLSELLQDAKEWISKPWMDFYKGGKNKRHPEFPKRPLSRYMIYYLKKKDKILKEHPKIEMTDVSKMIAKMYKNLPPEKQEKYNRLANKYKEEYEKKIEAFYNQHPEFKLGEKGTHGRVLDHGPKRPQTPFGLFYLNQLKSVEDPNIDKNVFKEKCKEQWKTLSDKKKVIWINWAEEEEIKYQEELKNYVSQNPDYVPTHTKSVLTKEERMLKERMAGKPVKPPTSAYSLFSQIMLQSEGIKKVSPKERMNVIAAHWKTCPEEEKKVYKERVQHLMEQYKLDFASYLESLSEEKRQEALMNIQPKRKAKADSEESPSKKLKKATPSTAAASTEGHAEEDNINTEAVAEKVGEASTAPIAVEISPVVDKPAKKKAKKVQKEESKAIGETSAPSLRKTTENSAPIETPVKQDKLEEDNEEEDAEIFSREPKQPPKTAYAYFLTKYAEKPNKDPVKSTKEIWEKFSRVTKRKYEKELDEMKHAYLIEFEKFLKTMSKPRLKRYIKMKAEQEAIESANDQNEAQNNEETSEESNKQEENTVEN